MVKTKIAPKAPIAKPAPKQKAARVPKEKKPVYPRRLPNGSIELGPPPVYGPKRKHRPMHSEGRRKKTTRTPEEVKAAEKALEKEKAQLRRNAAEMAEHQKKVAEHNKKRLEALANPPPPKPPMRLKVKVKAEKRPVVKLIVLKGHHYQRPCGKVPEEFRGSHAVTSDSPMFSRKGGFPPAHYNDSVPLPNLAMGVWLSDKAQNDLLRMQRDMEALAGRCMVEINEMSKSGRYKSALFPEVKRRLVMSLIQALSENK